MSVARYKEPDAVLAELAVKPARGQHQNLDPMTGACLDCGARHEQIDDNLFPTCEKITGPHRLAIIALRQATMRAHWQADWTENRLRQVENLAVTLSRDLAAQRDDERQLNASLEFLREANGMSPTIRQTPSFIVPAGPCDPWSQGGR